jgi:hypothetical protein
VPASASGQASKREAFFGETPTFTLLVGGRNVSSLRQSYERLGELRPAHRCVNVVLPIVRQLIKRAARRPSPLNDMALDQGPLVGCIVCFHGSFLLHHFACLLLSTRGLHWLEPSLTQISADLTAPFDQPWTVFFGICGGVERVFLPD